MKDIIIIYFHSPYGTGNRIKPNLKMLGLDESKKIYTVLTREFNRMVKNNNLDILNDYDVICLDEFYDSQIDCEICYNALTELLNNGKQIVMAGHEKIENLKTIPSNLKEKIITYDLKYGLDLR